MHDPASSQAGAAAPAAAPERAREQVRPSREVAEASWSRTTPGPEVQASPRPRRAFDPAGGWFRRLERRASVLLSRHVYPRLPGAARPYTRQIRRQLQVVEARLAIRGLGQGLHGAKLLWVSDLHAGPFLEDAYLETLVRRLEGLGADAVILGGDLVTSLLEEITPVARAVEGWRPPLGLYAVLGNHDHFTGRAGALAERLTAAGVEVLRNDARVLERGASSLLLLGVDDLGEGDADLRAAVARARSLAAGEDIPMILASHNPDVFFEAAALGIPWTLAGHTHGGQIRIPGLPVLVRQSRFRLDEGLYRCGDARLFVSRGLGVTGLPVRIACRPEVALFTLVDSGA